MKVEVLSDRATAIDLCLFDSATAAREADRLPLERLPNGRWIVESEELTPGQLYGLRADGPWEPERGNLFDRSKLLVDPRARTIVGPGAWHPSLRPEARGTDTAATAPRCLCVDGEFDWRDDHSPSRPWEQTVIYEAHVKGLTRRHPSLPEAERGTYLGLAHDAVVDHLLRLGVTALELMPVQHFFTERHLVEKGLTNYWGYSPLGWFAPHSAYAATGEPVSEFKEMVRRLHARGLEVILDLVFNHTAEGDLNGATVGLRGLDNALYYRLDAKNPARYDDVTGCGASVDLSDPRVAALVVDCLRYWVREMHVDGFRLDLATTLGRMEDGRFSRESPFFRAIADDPTFDEVKWIAEPWDAGPDGYQLGRFPPGWREWNDRFRDDVRLFWLYEGRDEAAIRRRLEGSPELFPPKTGRAGASINFVTSHDGFTLEDVVSYATKRNEANGEGNRDGHPNEISVAAEDDGLEAAERRRRRKRGMLASLLLADGVPMLSHGDELGRSQLGNNNAYCQDNELTWVDWSDAWSPLADLIAWLTRRRRSRAGS